MNIKREKAIVTIDKCEACNMGYGIELDRCHGYNHANAIIEKIRELHKLIIDNNAACGDIDCCGEYEEYELCADCYCEYPCPTIRIIDGIIDEDDE